MISSDIGKARLLALVEANASSAGAVLDVPDEQTFTRGMRRAVWSSLLDKLDCYKFMSSKKASETRAALDVHASDFQASAIDELPEITPESLFNVAIDRKLRGCDLVKLAVLDLVKDDRVRERVSVIQSKTKKPVQFELTENPRDTVIAWVRSPEMIGCRFMFPSRFHDSPHISTRQYGRLVRDWVTAIGLEPSGYGTHSLRRTKAAEKYGKTGNLRAAQLLLGHTKIDSMLRHLGVELDDALNIADRNDI